MKTALFLLITLVVSTPAWAEEPDARMVELVQAATRGADYHANNRWEHGIKRWTTTCWWSHDWADSSKPCAGLVANGTASIVRDEKHRGQYVVQEIWLLRYEDSRAADAASKALRAMKYGPFQKHPYQLWRVGEREIVAVEGRSRFPKFLDELAEIVRERFAKK